MGTKIKVLPFLLATLVVSACLPKKVTIDGAFMLSETQQLYMVADGTMLLIAGGNEHATGDFTSASEAPAGFNVKAIVGTYVTNKVLYYGDEYVFFKDYQDNTKSRKLKYGRQRAFIRDGGPDAAARRDGEMTFFKGCKMAIRYKWNRWGKPTDMRDAGLPCHLDAAWSTGENYTVLLRGDEIWFWHFNNTLEGPSLFNSTYTIKTWELLPYEGSNQ